jgi:GAF domain-containing protein
VFSGGPFRFERLRDLPDDLQPDRQYFASQGIGSHVAVPLRLGSRVIGGLACTTVGTERPWPDALLRELELVAGMLAPVAARFGQKPGAS